MSWPTTRKHPRTLNEAFPDVRANWCEGWTRKQSNVGSWILAAFIGVAFAVVIAYNVR